MVSPQMLSVINEERKYLALLLLKFKAAIYYYLTFYTFYSYRWLFKYELWTIQN